MKDNTNTTLLQYIMKKISATEDDLPLQLKELCKTVNIKDIDTAYLKTKTGELQAMVG